LVANILALAGSLLRNWANRAAAIGFLVDLMTAVVEPPQLPERGWDASHCGSGAARHLPAVALADPERKAGPQAAVSQVAYLPLLKPAYHASVKSGSVLMTLCHRWSVRCGSAGRPAAMRARVASSTGSSGLPFIDSPDSEPGTGTESTPVLFSSHAVAEFPPA
jgi:hypothetical protein